MGDEIHIHISAKSITDVESWMVKSLREMGYFVQRPLIPVLEKETPKKMMLRLGLSSAYLSRKLNAPECPPFQCKRGASGRIVWLVSNEPLEKYLGGGTDA